MVEMFFVCSLLLFSVWWYICDKMLPVVWCSRVVLPVFGQNNACVDLAFITLCIWRLIVLWTSWYFWFLPCFYTGVLSLQETCDVAYYQWRVCRLYICRSLCSMRLVLIIGKVLMLLVNQHTLVFSGYCSDCVLSVLSQSVVFYRFYFVGNVVYNEFLTT